MSKHILSEKPEAQLEAAKWAKEELERIRKSDEASIKANEILGPILRENIKKAKEEMTKK